MKSKSTKKYTAEQLLRKFQGRYIEVYPYFNELRIADRWITVYEVRGISDTLKENYNLPYDCLV